MTYLYQLFALLSLLTPAFTLAVKAIAMRSALAFPFYRPYEMKNWVLRGSVSCFFLTVGHKMHDKPQSTTDIITLRSVTVACQLRRWFELQSGWSQVVFPSWKKVLETVWIKSLMDILIQCSEVFNMLNQFIAADEWWSSHIWSIAWFICYCCWF